MAQIKTTQQLVSLVEDRLALEKRLYRLTTLPLEQQDFTAIDELKLQLNRHPVVLYKPLIYKGDIFTNKYTKMVVILGDPNDSKIKSITNSLKGIINIDYMYNLLKLSYGVHKARGGWLTIKNVPLSLTANPFCTMHDEVITTTSLNKLRPFGQSIGSRLVILESNYYPSLQELKQLYYSHGNINVLHVRKNSKKQLSVTATVKKYYSDTTTTLSLFNYIIQYSNCRLIAHHDIFAVFRSKKAQRENEASIKVDTIVYEQESKPLETEGVVTQDNKYLYADEDLLLYDRKTDLLIRLQCIINPLADEYDDVLTIEQVSAREYQFIIDTQLLLTKELIVSEQEAIDFLEELQEEITDLVMQ